MQAIILAAGRGSRLGEKGADRPKCLLEIGRRPLIEWQLELLAEAGVAPVGVVVGYCADEIREHVGIRAEFIENPRWSQTNSLYSFWLTRAWVTGPVVVLNSDTLLHPKILDRLLDAPGDAFAYDSISGTAREHMKVKLSNQMLVDMSKQLSPQESDGENVGVLKFTKNTVQALYAHADQLIEAGDENNWLSSAVRSISKDYPLRGVDVSGLAWGEIDSSWDLDQMRKKIWPAIARSTHRRKSKWRFVPVAMLMGMGLLFAYTTFQTFVSKKQEMAWEIATIPKEHVARIAAEGREQSWWLLENGKEATVRVSGPGVLRIDSRPVMAKHLGQVPYVLEVRLDNKIIDWYKYAEAPSGSWENPKWPVGRRNRLKIELPIGPHQLSVRLIESGSKRALIRILESVGEDLDEL